MKENDNKKSLKEMWKDPQKKAIIKLGLWFVFFALTFLFLSVASLFSKHNNLNNNNNENNQNNQNNQEEKVEANVPKMLEKLLNSNYSYEIKITGDNETKTLSGAVNDKITSGFIETNGNIIKYSYHDEKYFQINQNEEIENNELLTEEQKDNINLHNILDDVNNYEANNKILKEENIYNYDINDTYKIKISINDNNINYIYVLNNNISYEMNFKIII